MSTNHKTYAFEILWLIIFIAVFAWSAINPKDYYTWGLEVVPAVIGLLVMAVTYRSFKLTTLIYILILIHCVILMIGGHYTYAEVPFFNDLFGSARNNYDKVGHFAQGFIPALITREIILRKNIIRASSWQLFFIICFCLAFSAFYELIEWWVALLSEQSAEAFLGTQGYIWDTQSDMGFALLGAIIALASLTKLHDQQLAKIQQ
ncbi:MAG: DUF2238 domain-containing protein [Methylophagaceae bacterium]